MASRAGEVHVRPERSAEAAPTAVARRLPGKARPREEVLREYRALNAKRRERIPPPLWPFWAPDPDEHFRWRVQLDCGCITEVLTWGDKKQPAEQQWFDAVRSARLPAGQIICVHDDAPPQPYRKIVEWGDRREISFPADPVEPRHGLDPETWAKIRHDEPHASAFWSVTLSCGHVTDVVADLDWQPADGPRLVSATRQQEMIAEFEEFWASDPDAQNERDREHTRRMLAQGWPRPEPEKLCYTCSWARHIIAYQRVGWLVPRKLKPKPPMPPSRATLERRLRRAETEAERLRHELAQLGTQDEDQGIAADE